MIKKHIKGIVILVIIAALIVCGVIFIPKLLSGKKAEGNVTQQINTVALTKMDLTESVSATGTIESASTATVSADVQGVTVKDVLVEVGDTVTKGQRLVTFDKSELNEALENAEADYNDAKTEASQDLQDAYNQLSQARTTYATQKKQLEATVKEAKAALKKAKKAAKSSKSSSVGSDTESASTSVGAGEGNGGGAPSQGGSSGNSGDNASTTGSGSSGSGTSVPAVTISDDMTVSEAEAAYKQAKENLENANAQNLQSIKTAQAQVSKTKTNNEKNLRQAKQAVTDAKNTLKSASIKATMDGTVTALGVEKGSVYNGSDAVEISDLTQFQVTTTVDEYDINKIEKGQRVVILTDATGDTEIEGSITYVALTMGSSTLSGSEGSGASGNSSMGESSSTSSSGYEVRIALNGIVDSIRSGMTAKCSIIINEASDVYAVPYDAIHTNNNSEDVIYVMDSSGARSEVVVTKGMESDYYVEISGDGLSENLSVIIPSDETSTTSSESSESSSGALDGLMGGNRSGNMGGGPGGGDMGGGPGGPGN